MVLMRSLLWHRQFSLETRTYMRMYSNALQSFNGYSNTEQEIDKRK